MAAPLGLLINVLVIVLVIVVVLWVVRVALATLGAPPAISTLAYAILVLIVLLWALSFLGLLDGLPTAGRLR